MYCWFKKYNWACIGRGMLRAGLWYLIRKRGWQTSNYNDTTTQYPDPLPLTSEWYWMMQLVTRLSSLSFPWRINSCTLDHDHCSWLIAERAECRCRITYSGGLNGLNDCLMDTPIEHISAYTQSYIWDAWSEDLEYLAPATTPCHAFTAIYTSRPSYSYTDSIENAVKEELGLYTQVLANEQS